MTWAAWMAFCILSVLLGFGIGWCRFQFVKNQANPLPPSVSLQSASENGIYFCVVAFKLFSPNLGGIVAARYAKEFIHNQGMSAKIDRFSYQGDKRYWVYLKVDEPLL